MKTVVIIPAAGTGKRFGNSIPKQYLELRGIPTIIRTLLLFENIPQIRAIVVAVHPDWEDFLRTAAVRYGISKLSDIQHGGAERQESIASALRSESAEEADIILVHDAVRPFCSSDLVRRIIVTAAETGAAIPATMPKETIKRVADDTIIETVDRSMLRAAQTPQGFRAEVLRAAYAAAGNMLGTDDASLAEAAGFQVTIISGEERNIKITTQFDWSIAELIVAEQEKLFANGTTREP